MESTAANLINLDYLRLMADNDEEMVQTMLSMLLEELPEEMTKIQGLAAIKDWDELTKVSHKMKSTLSFVGNDDMTAANKELERITKYKTGIEHVDSYVAKLVELFPTVMDALQKEVKIA